MFAIWMKFVECLTVIVSIDIIKMRAIFAKDAIPIVFFA